MVITKAIVKNLPETHLNTELNNNSQTSLFPQSGPRVSSFHYEHHTLDPW